MSQGRSENSTRGSPRGPPVGSLLGRQAGQPGCPVETTPTLATPLSARPPPAGRPPPSCPTPAFRERPLQAPCSQPRGTAYKTWAGGYPSLTLVCSSAKWRKTSLEKHSQARRVHLITIINSSTAYGRYQAPALAVRDERSPCAPQVTSLSLRFTSAQSEVAVGTQAT